MATTYKAIATVTVGSGGAANIEFTSIPATYTDLIILASIRTNRNDRNDALSLQFNGSGGTAYTHTLLFGNGGSANTQRETSQASVTYVMTASGATATASSFGSAMIYIPNYAGSVNKSISSETASASNHSASDGDQVIYLNAGSWADNSAITSAKITPQFGNLIVQHSTATLYGIKNS